MTHGWRGRRREAMRREDGGRGEREKVNDTVVEEQQSHPEGWM